ncbi:uncharacterized protein METZ01_LOCUS330310, partial [marine metagenome]
MRTQSFSTRAVNNKSRPIWHHSKSNSLKPSFGFFTPLPPTADRERLP